MSRPNILLLTTDQHHHSCLGVTNPTLKTPALDRLAWGGTRFTRAYCPNPLCSPARASMITGLYPSVHGCWTIGVKLPEDAPTVGQMLGEAGYETALVGKAHFQPTRSVAGSESIETAERMRDLDFWKGFRGPWYGFQHVEISRGHVNRALVGGHYALWLEEKGLTNWRDYFEPGPGERREDGQHGHGGHEGRGGYGRQDPAGGDQSQVWALPEALHQTHWVAERAAARMAHAKETGKPFFVWASFYDPHPPFLVPEPWASMYDPAEMEPGQLTPGEHEKNPPHFRMTQEERPNFRPYRETFGAHGLSSHRHTREALQRDMAAYFGMISLLDRGVERILARLDELGLAENTLVVFTTDHGHFLGQHGLVAKGPFHYEDMIRLPFLVRMPAQVPAGRVSAALQSTVDLAPTFLAAADLPIPGAMQGTSQWGVWRGERGGERDHAIVENRHEPTTVHLRTYVEDRYKLTIYRGQPYGELFDLDEDPREIRNLWHEPAAASIKARLMAAFLDAELRREPMRMPRVASA